MLGFLPLSYDQLISISISRFFNNNGTLANTHGVEPIDIPPLPPSFGVPPPFGSPKSATAFANMASVTEWVNSLISNLVSQGRSSIARGQPHELAAIFSRMIDSDPLGDPGFSLLNPSAMMSGGIRAGFLKAAPVLADPRCGGIQLSVYVPPPKGHPNAGMMPDAEFEKGNMREWKKRGRLKSSGEDHAAKTKTKVQRATSPERGKTANAQVSTRRSRARGQ